MFCLHTAMHRVHIVLCESTQIHVHALYSQGDFTAIVDLPEGEHEYKFFVDGEWLHNPDEVCR